jgi:hypothetical protein
MFLSCLHSSGGRPIEIIYRFVIRRYTYKALARERDFPRALRCTHRESDFARRRRYAVGHRPRAPQSSEFNTAILRPQLFSGQSRSRERPADLPPPTQSAGLAFLQESRQLSLRRSRFQICAAALRLAPLQHGQGLTPSCY